VTDEPDFFSTDDFLKNGSTEHDSTEPDRNSSEMQVARSLFQRTGSMEPMTKGEAVRCTKRIKCHKTNRDMHELEVARCLWEMDERGGYKSLTNSKTRKPYANIAEYAYAEFGYKTAYSYRLVSAAKVDNFVLIEAEKNSTPVEKFRLSINTLKTLADFAERYYNPLYAKSVQLARQEENDRAAKEKRLPLPSRTKPNPRHINHAAEHLGIKTRKEEKAAEENDADTEEKKVENETANGFRLKTITPHPDQGIVTLAMIYGTQAVGTINLSKLELQAMLTNLEDSSDADDCGEEFAEMEPQAKLLPPPHHSRTQTDEDDEDDGFSTQNFLDSAPDYSPSVHAAGYSASDGKSRQQVEVEFKLFWEAYPSSRRGDKRKTQTEWNKAREGAEFNDIMQGLARWKQSDQWQEEKFIVHAERFLRGSRWETTFDYVPEKSDTSVPVKASRDNSLAENAAYFAQRLLDRQNVRKEAFSPSALIAQ